MKERFKIEKARAACKQGTDKTHLASHKKRKHEVKAAEAKGAKVAKNDEKEKQVKKNDEQKKRKEQVKEQQHKLLETRKAQAAARWANDRQTEHGAEKEPDVPSCSENMPFLDVGDCPTINNCSQPPPSNHDELDIWKDLVTVPQPSLSDDDHFESDDNSLPAKT